MGRDVCAPARLPAWAIVVSLAVHGVFLAGPAWHTLRQAAPSVPLLATLRLSAPVPVAMPAPPAAPRREAPPPDAAARMARVSPAAPRDSHERALPPLQGEEDTNPIPLPTSPLKGEETVPSPRAEAPAEAPPPDAGAMARYVRLLTELLARQQQYPRLAALRGWQGEVRLRLQVARKGAIVAVQVLQSSGFEVLDRHALQLVQQAANLPRLPEALREHEFHIVVPVHYRLEKAT